jgi:putative flavoprotein involved in K+ transport
MKHVVIIGAGPAGLAAASGLARRGVAYTLLERGAEPAAALRTVDPDMALFSPARLSRLRDMTFDAGARYPTFRQLVAALDRFRAQRDLVVTTGQQVVGVDRSGDRFVVRTQAGASFDATHVINASGIASFPQFPPDVDRNALGIRSMHSIDVRCEHVEAARRLLVVGAGASAADVLGHWRAVRKPGDRAWIAARSKIRALPSSLLGIDTHWWVWLFEHLPGRPFGPWLSPKDAMWGKHILRAIRGGEIEPVGIARYAPGAVELADGSRIEPDLVVFATGFAHDTRHLGDGVARDATGWPIARRCESVCTPGLYVLGSRFARSLASSFLRGIGRDAEYVARRIAA